MSPGFTTSLGDSVGVIGGLGTLFLFPGLVFGIRGAAGCDEGCGEAAYCYADDGGCFHNIIFGCMGMSLLVI